MRVFGGGGGERDEVGGGGASGCDADDVRVHKRCDGWIESAGVTPRA